MKKSSPLLFLIAALCFCSVFVTGCGKGGSSSWMPTKGNVSGFYVSESGALGWGGSIRLSHGSFILKEPALSSGRLVGDYGVDGDTITFYSDGMKVFEATAYKDRLVIRGRGIVYQKK